MEKGCHSGPGALPLESTPLNCRRGKRAARAQGRGEIQREPADFRPQPASPKRVRKGQAAPPELPRGSAGHRGSHTRARARANNQGTAGVHGGAVITGQRVAEGERGTPRCPTQTTQLGHAPKTKKRKTDPSEAGNTTGPGDVGGPGRGTWPEPCWGQRSRCEDSTAIKCRSKRH